MHPLVASLQGRLVEVYFGFQKVAEAKQSYADISNNIDDRFDQIYGEPLRLAEQVGSIEQRPRLCGLQRFRNNAPSGSIHTYWKRSVAIPFLDVICNEIAARFNDNTRAHFELCALIPEVTVSQGDAGMVKLSTLNGIT